MKGGEAIAVASPACLKVVKYVADLTKTIRYTFLCGPF